MKIGIITQPLWDNYGGLLQNWALQHLLKRLGHTPLTIDYLPTSYPISLRALVAFKNIIKSTLFFCKFEKGTLNPFTRSKYAEDFINKQLKTTHRVDEYKRALIKQYEFEGIVVGSDQVWRPRYNLYLSDMFLSFCKGEKLVRLSYAASLGVDCWELNRIQTYKAGKLIKLFNGISVREQSAVQLLKSHLSVDAKLVLDPTLMLTASDYELIESKHWKYEGKYIASYIINRKSTDSNFFETQIENHVLAPIVQFSADANISASVGDWLNAIKQSEFVITDSFHGMVFAIIYRRPFYVIVNKDRGASRFKSLLEAINLTNRMILSPSQKLDFSPIQWESVEGLLQQMRNNSLNFLKKNLNGKPSN